MTKTLSDRQKHIVHVLLETEETLTVDELVRRLEVSRRTIQRDLQAIQRAVSEFRVRLDLGPPVVLRGTKAALAEMKQGIGKLPATFRVSPRTREIQLAMDLLMEDGPSKLEYFGRMLHVTPASLSQQMDDLSEWLKERQLELVRRRGYGVEIRGSEATRREAVTDLVYDQVTLPDLMSILRQEDEKAQQHPIYQWIGKWFGEKRIAHVRTVLMAELAPVDPPLDEAGFYGFMLHVLLSCARIEQDARIPPSTAAGHAADTHDYQVCLRILHHVLPTTRGDLSGETAYLANHLRGAKVLMTEATKILPHRMTSMDLSYQMVKRLEERLDLSLTEDRNLIVGMAQHLEPAIHRMTSGLLIRNPLLDEIKSRYPDLFDAMKVTSQTVLASFGIQVPDAEVGFLTMHLGAATERQRAKRIWRVRIVCPNGISSAELLASRIQKELPQIQIVALGSLYEPEQATYDFVVSTVPLDSEDKPVVTVSPFLSVAERDAILALIHKLETNVGSKEKYKLTPTRSQEGVVEQAVTSILDELRVHNVSAKDMDGVIQRVISDLEPQHSSDELAQIRLAIVQREQLGNISLPGKHLSVLHARSDAIHQVVACIYRLHESIRVAGVANRWEAVDTVLVLLARETEQTAIIRLLGRISAALVMEESMVALLRNGTVVEIREAWRRVMTQIEE